MCPVPVHPDLPGFHYVKGVHWMVLAGAVADRVLADKKGRVFVVRSGYKPRNVTLAAKSLLGRGLIEPWAPGETVWATDLGRTYLARKHPTGHPDFVKVMAAKAQAIAREAAEAAGDAASRQAAQEPPTRPRTHQHPTSTRPQHRKQMEPSQ